MELLGYFAAVFIGICLGMLGGGGAILTIPVLVYLFGISPIVASHYSILIVGITSLAGGLRYHLRGLVDLRVTVLFGIPCLVGVLLSRNYVIKYIPDQVHIYGQHFIARESFFMLAFASFMILAAAFMLSGTASMEKAWKDRSKPAPVLSIPVGLVIGGISGLLGIGGGFLIIPTLAIIFRLSIKTAVGTSLGIIVLNSVAAILGTDGLMQIDWRLFTGISLVALAGMAIGTRIAQTVKARVLQKLLAVMMLLIAASIFFTISL